MRTTQAAHQMKYNALRWAKEAAMHAMAVIFDMLYGLALEVGADWEVVDALRSASWFFIGLAMEDPLYRDAEDYPEGWGPMPVECPHDRERSCAVCSTWNGEEETGGRVIPTLFQRRQAEVESLFEQYAGSPVVRVVGDGWTGYDFDGPPF